jgi:hypothetical protein
VFTSPVCPFCILTVPLRLFQSISLTVKNTKGQTHISRLCRISVPSHHPLGSCAVPSTPLDICDVSFIVNCIYGTSREKFSQCTSFPYKLHFEVFYSNVERGLLCLVEYQLHCRKEHSVVECFVNEMDTVQAEEEKSRIK